MENEALSRHGAILLSAMANEKRLQILLLLIAGELSVGEIADAVGLSQSAVSQHLRILRVNRLVKSRRQQQAIYYYDPSVAVRGVLDVLAENMDIRPKLRDGDGEGGVRGRRS